MYRRHEEVIKLKQQNHKIKAKARSNNIVTQYLLNNVTDAQTTKNGTRNKQNRYCI